jgi:predicted metal-dependent TIM-barrel fold hydrolase
MPDWEPNLSDDDLIINHIHDDTVDEVSDEEMAFFDAIRARIMEGRNVANVGAEPPAARAAGC